MNHHLFVLFCAIFLSYFPVRAFGQSDTTPSPEVVLAMGVVAFHDGDYLAAAEHLRRALALEPDHLTAAHYLGRSLLAQDDPDRALEVLEPAAASHPEAWELQVDLGVTYLELGNDAFAARTLERVVEARPEAARSRLFLGAALSRLGDCDLAARHLAEARRLEESFSSDTGALAALCHARAGDLAEARVELGPLARSPRDEPLADVARRIVRLSLRAEGIETARVSASAAVAIQYDSNPTLASNTSANDHSAAPVFQLDAIVRVVATERHTLAGRVGFYRSFYLPDERAADYNYTHIAASAFYQLRGRLGGAQHQLQLGYDFALGLFDGDPPLADENHLYSELHGLRTQWSIRETDRLQTRVSIVGQDRTFAVRRRNAFSTTIGVGQTIAFPRRGLQAFIEGTVRLEDAQSRDYDVVAPGVLLSLSGRLPWELIVSGWALFEHEIHPASSEDRVDEQLTTSLAIQRQIIPHLGLTLSWMHTENISTGACFDYRRDVVSLSIWGVL